MKIFTVTVGQLVLSDPEEVFEQIDKTLLENPDSDLFVFPEFASQSNVDISHLSYLEGKPTARKKVKNWCSLVPAYPRIKRLAERSQAAILIGCLAQEAGKLFSRAYFYDPQNQQQDYYDKTHVHWTEDFLKPGTSIEPILSRFGKIGCLICYDMAFVEPTRVLGIKGVEVLFALSAIPRAFHWRYPHHRMIGAAIFNQVYVVAAQLGHSRQAPMGGYSGIYGPEGDLIKQINHDDYGWISAEIDLEYLRRWREEEIIPPYRKPSLYGAITAPLKDE
jgi:predicted amidohydrolase